MPLHADDVGIELSIVAQLPGRQNMAMCQSKGSRAMLGLLGTIGGAANHLLVAACVFFALAVLVMVLFLCLLAVLGRKAIRWLLPAAVEALIAIGFLGVFFEVVISFASSQPIYTSI
jgi:hypothetical protein